MKIYCNSSRSNIREYAEQYVGTGLWIKVKNIFHPSDMRYYIKFVEFDDESVTVNFIDTEDLTFVDHAIKENVFPYCQWLMSRELHLLWRDVDIWYDVCIPVEAYTDDDMLDLLTKN